MVSKIMKASGSVRIFDKGILKGSNIWGATSTPKLLNQLDTWRVQAMAASGTGKKQNNVRRHQMIATYQSTSDHRGNRGISPETQNSRGQLVNTGPGPALPIQTGLRHADPLWQPLARS
jgi:hypothetical protein